MIDRLTPRGPALVKRTPHLPPALSAVRRQLTIGPLWSERDTDYAKTVDRLPLKKTGDPCDANLW